MTTSLPTDRRADRPFDPPEGPAELPALSRLTFADGHEGWLAKSHDLVREILAAQPVTAQVICELLGVPYGERATFMRNALDLFKLGAAPEETAAAYGIHALPIFLEAS